MTEAVAAIAEGNTEEAVVSKVNEAPDGEAEIKAEEEVGITGKKAESDIKAEPGSEGTPEADVLAKPIKYTEFQLPEGVGVEDKVMDAFKELAGEKGLSQEDAQKFLNLLPEGEKKAAEAWNTTKDEWKTNLKSDPEIGGDKLDGVSKNVNDMISSNTRNEAFQSEMEAILSEFGMGVNTAFVDTMNNVYTSHAKEVSDLKADNDRMRIELGDDTIGDTNKDGGSTPPKKSIEERLWPDQDKK